MLHYHPISGTGGGGLEVSLHVAVYRIMCLREVGGVGWMAGGSSIALQTRNWVEQPPPQLTRPCTF